MEIHRDFMPVALAAGATAIVITATVYFDVDTGLSASASPKSKHRTSGRRHAAATSLDAVPHAAFAALLVTGTAVPAAFGIYLPALAFDCATRFSTWWLPYLLGWRGRRTERNTRHTRQSRRWLPPIAGRAAPTAVETMVFPACLATLGLGATAWAASDGGLRSASRRGVSLAAAAGGALLLPRLLRELVGAAVCSDDDEAGRRLAPVDELDIDSGDEGDALAVSGARKRLAAAGGRVGVDGTVIVRACTFAAFVAWMGVRIRDAR